VIGSKASIEAMTVEEMRRYFARRYAANNLILAVAGNLEWPQVLELAEKYCSDWQVGDEGRPTEPFVPTPQVQHIQRDLQQQYILLGYPFPAQESKEYYAAMMGADILGDGSGSRLFWNITHKGLAEAAVSQYSPFNGLGMHFFFVASAPEAATDVLALVRGELQSIEADGVHE